MRQTDYYSMNRIYKHYSLPITGAAAVNISFSSRPGMLSSKDDWYTMSSGTSNDTRDSSPALTSY
jgi:hypothetical protein